MYTYRFPRHTREAAHSRDVSCYQLKRSLHGPKNTILPFVDGLPMTIIHLAYPIYCFQVFPFELAGKDTHEPLRG
jgi:hypothetical protein